MSSADWFDRIGVDKNGRKLCGMFHLHALTVDPDGTHILWCMGYPVHTGPREQIRPLYANTLGSHWLAEFYR